jgi:hypothetical protein
VFTNLGKKFMKGQHSSAPRRPTVLTALLDSKAEKGDADVSATLKEFSQALNANSGLQPTLSEETSIPWTDGSAVFEDKFQPLAPTAILSPSQVRAIKAEVIAGPSTGALTANGGAARFQTPAWDPFAMVSQARTSMLGKSAWTELWYAQAAIKEPEQKRQLSHKAIRSRPSAAGF